MKIILFLCFSLLVIVSAQDPPDGSAPRHREDRPDEPYGKYPTCPSWCHREFYDGAEDQTFEDPSSPRQSKDEHGVAKRDASTGNDEPYTEGPQDGHYSTYHSRY